MLCEQENNSNLHTSCSSMFQLQANIDKQQLLWHSAAYMVSTPSFDVYTHL